MPASTTREEAKTKKRQELLSAAADAIARNGFRETRLQDIGAAVGISGPGIYRYVDSKEALLAEIMVEISERLLAGAQAILASGEEARVAPVVELEQLVDFHLDVTVNESSLVYLQMREVGNLDEVSGEKVRELQRAYMRIWTDVLLRVHPSLTRPEARLRVQLVAGMLNATRYVIHWADPDMVREHGRAMAMDSFLAAA